MSALQFHKEQLLELVPEKDRTEAEIRLHRVIYHVLMPNYADPVTHPSPKDEGTVPWIVGAAVVLLVFGMLVALYLVAVGPPSR